MPPATRRSPWVVALDSIDADDLALVGGKAANLGELIAAGLSVPDGFCVTADAYREIANLGPILDRLAAGA